MDQAGIIRDLLIWLEGHLDQPLSLDNVAAKAGYSKWHLQRMFKDVTGHAIGAYIRARRLSKSAVALRLTAAPDSGYRSPVPLRLSAKPLPAPLKNSFPKRRRCIVAPRNGAPLAFALHYVWENLLCRSTSS
ncbi:right origin-binding protein [Salmonella bongori]|nr:right origin-binding protein [Salmonella bongori]